MSQADSEESTTTTRDTDVWSLLRCPRCQSSLELEAAQVRCQRCGKAYPLLLGIPLITARPEEWLERWGQGLAGFAQRMGQAQRQLQTEFFDQDLSERSQNRVRQVIGALGRHLEEVLTILARAGIAPGSTPGSTEQQLNDYSPEPYFSNILRDFAWCSEGDEVDVSLSQLTLVLPSAFESGTTLVLGAGTGRLAWEFASRFTSFPVLALDVDPLLLVTTQLLREGEPVCLTELPAHPRQSSAVARTHRLQCPLPAAPNLTLLLADGLDPPLARGKFDTVVTPWFVDEVPNDAALAVELVRALLREGGSFICVGPFLYDNAHTSPAQRYCVDEFLELVERAGFEITSHRYVSEPYMVSPLSSRHRVESVLYLHAQKDTTRRVERPLLPPYLQPGAGASVSIPVFEGLHSREFSPREVLEVAALIDGKRNVRQISSTLVARGVLAKDGTEESAVRGSLKIILQQLQGPAKQG